MSILDHLVFGSITESRNLKVTWLLVYYYIFYIILKHINHIPLYPYIQDIMYKLLIIKK